MREDTELGKGKHRKTRAHRDSIYKNRFSASDKGTAEKVSVPRSVFTLEKVNEVNGIVNAYAHRKAGNKRSGNVQFDAEKTHRRKVTQNRDTYGNHTDKYCEQRLV